MLHTRPVVQLHNVDNDSLKPARQCKTFVLRRRRRRCCRRRHDNITTRTRTNTVTICLQRGVFMLFQPVPAWPADSLARRMPANSCDPSEPDGSLLRQAVGPLKLESRPLMVSGFRGGGRWRRRMRSCFIIPRRDIIPPTRVRFRSDSRSRIRRDYFILLSLVS